MVFIWLNFGVVFQIPVQNYNKFLIYANFLLKKMQKTHFFVKMRLFGYKYNFYRLK